MLEDWEEQTLGAVSEGYAVSNELFKAAASKKEADQTIHPY
jgi:hypothetical protein